jgi:hypothetical protein
MEETKDILELEFKEVKLPKTLIFLTSLSFIDLGIEIFNLIISFFRTTAQMKFINKFHIENNDSLNTMITEIVNHLNIQEDNKFIYSIVSLLAIILCYKGLKKMRLLHKNAYLLYTISELIIPIFCIILYSIVEGFSFNLFAYLFFPVIFIILYATQRKYLIN